MILIWKILDLTNVGWSVRSVKAKGPMREIDFLDWQAKLERECKAG
jgi:hypothetical protein